MSDVDFSLFTSNALNPVHKTGNYSWNRPASWPPMDLTSPVSRGHRLLAITTVCTSLAFITVSLRIYTRTKITRYMGWDDWFIMLAMTASFGLYGLQIGAMTAGWYHHVWDVPYDQFVRTKKIGLSIQSLYPWILGFMKTSILLFYLRLSASPPFRLVVQITLGFISIYTVASSLAILFQCWPFNTRLGNPTSTCVNFIALNYTIASLNIATDVFVYLLSWVMVRHLKVSKSQKIAVLIIFSVGALVCIFSGLRFYYLRDYWNSSDPTWVAYYISIMSTLEANVAIITSSVPAIKPLVTKVFPRSGFCRSSDNSAESTCGRFNRSPNNAGSMGTENAPSASDGEIFEKIDSNGINPLHYDSHPTTIDESNIGRSRRELSDEDLGFPDGFDGKYGPPPTNWDDHAPGSSAQGSIPGSPGEMYAEPPIPRIGPRVGDMSWYDKEITMATDGMDIASFKKGNMNAKMDLVDALRGGPVGIIPDPPGGSRRQSEAPFGPFR